MLIDIKNGIIHGTGKKLYTLIFIDQDDSEDTTVDLWLANSDRHLEKQAKEYYASDGDDGDGDGDDDESRDMFGNTLSERWDEDWGFLIIPNCIGKVPVEKKIKK